MGENKNSYGEETETPKTCEAPGWNRKVFTNMLKSAEQFPEEKKFNMEKQAYEYRFKTLGEAIPERFLKKQTPEIEDIIEDPEVNGNIDEDEDEDEDETINDNVNIKKSAFDDLELEDEDEKGKESTIETLREMLKNNDIKFFAGASYKVLYELCLKNNLIEKEV